MMIKYRVSEVAKDFDAPSKEVIELLGKFVDTPKKSMTALEENELDLVFEHFTQKNQVENFDAYFATAQEKKEEPAPAAPAESVSAASAETPAAAGKPAQQPGAKQGQPQQSQAPRAGQPQHPQQKPKQPAQPKAPVERRTIDTRTPQVNVGKYDEKFDVLAQTSNRVQGDGGAVKKQKINQKSQQYRKPHPRRETQKSR